MICIDTSIFSLLLGGKPPQNPETGEIVDLAFERVDDFIQRSSSAGNRIVLPTPCLAEFLVFSGPNKQEQVDILTRQAGWWVCSFDGRAALEHALIVKGAIDSGDKRQGSNQTWTKVKFDYQFLAIAKVNGCDCLLSDDGGLRKLVAANGLKALATWDLDIPDDKRQAKMEFDDKQKAVGPGKVD